MPTAPSSLMALLTVELDSAVCRGNQYRACPTGSVGELEFFWPLRGAQKGGCPNVLFITKMAF